MPRLPFGHGRRLPAWVLQLVLTVASVVLALGGAAMLADRRWMVGTVLFGLAVLVALIAALLRNPSANHRRP